MAIFHFSQFEHEPFATPCKRRVGALLLWIFNWNTHKVLLSLIKLFIGERSGMFDKLTLKQAFHTYLDQLQRHTHAYKIRPSRIYKT